MCFKQTWSCVIFGCFSNSSNLTAIISYKTDQNLILNSHCIVKGVCREASSTSISSELTAVDGRNLNVSGGGESCSILAAQCRQNAGCQISACVLGCFLQPWWNGYIFKNPSLFFSALFFFFFMIFSYTLQKYCIAKFKRLFWRSPLDYPVLCRQDTEEHWTAYYFGAEMVLQWDW